MKDFKAILLVMLTAFMGMAVQSCNNDDDAEILTLRMSITDKGNLPDNIYNSYESAFTSSQKVSYNSLSEAKTYVKNTIVANKSAMEQAMILDNNTYNFTLSYLLINGKGEQVYKISYKIEGTKVTVVESTPQHQGNRHFFHIWLYS